MKVDMVADMKVYKVADMRVDKRPNFFRHPSLTHI